MARHVTPQAPTVLLVESHRDDRMMYAEFLRAQQFRIVEADNGSEALLIAPTSDVVVTDIRLSGPFDGIELTRRLRADNQTMEKPILVLTACVFEPDQQHAHAAGCTTFLPKPCLPDTLLAAIQHVLPIELRPRSRPIRATRSRRTRRIA